MGDRKADASVLTPRQARFVEEYIIDLNATQAALRAGYAESGASVEGARLLANAKIQAAVQVECEKRSERVEVTQDMVLRELKRLGFSDIRRMFHADGSLRAIHELTADEAACISSVEVVTKRLPTMDGEPPEIEYVHKIKAWDKVQALLQIGRHLGMFVDKFEGKIVDDITGLSTEAIRDELARRQRARASVGAGVSAPGVSDEPARVVN